MVPKGTARKKKWANSREKQSTPALGLEKILVIDSLQKEERVIEPEEKRSQQQGKEIPADERKKEN